MASMFVSDAAADELVAAGGTWQGPNHYFVPQGDLVSSLELGGVPHEGCAGEAQCGARGGVVWGGVVRDCNYSLQASQPAALGGRRLDV